MKLIKSGLIHPFMVGIFPIIFIFTNNLSEISGYSLLLPMGIIFGVITISIFLLNKFSKNIQKTNLTISFLLIIFFSIGYVRLWIGNFQIYEIPLADNRVLIFCYVVITILGLGIIYKIRNIEKPTQIISVISIAILISFVPSIIEDFVISENIQDYSMNKIQFNNNKPNIYFIILDGYAGEESLTNDFNFDNSDMINFLNELGFYHINNSFSNYGGTGLTTTSILNMNYLDKIDGYSPNNKLLEKKVFSNNLVMKTLKDNGYNTFFIDGGAAMRDIKVSDKIFCHETDNGLLQTLIDTSFLTYVYQGFLWKSWEEIRNCGFTELENIGSDVNEPFFVYAHLRTPHDPYTRDIDGNFIQYKERLDQLDESTSNERYIYQLKYTNQKMKEIIPKLLTVDKKPIIILISDHGWEQFPNNPPTDADLKQWHSNFEVMYLPDIEEIERYNGISPVNIFRMIFDDYFGTKLERLEDRAYYVETSNSENELKQIDITNIFK